MDTITQALLGGAVGFVVAGKKSPRKAVLTGAAIAVLPDLDVFIPYANDLDSMTLHRSWTHSWLVHTLLAPLLAWLIYWRDNSLPLRDWWLIVWLALLTHAGLDALTVYGTQLFWPFTFSPVSGGSIFIIDPIYSLLLLTGFIAVMLRPMNSAKWMIGALLLSTLYLLWGFAAQQWVAQKARDTLIEQDIDWQHLQIGATAFNTLLWRVIVVNDQHYYEGYYSVFDGDQPLLLQRFDRGEDIAALSEAVPAVERLNWFTRGLFKTEQNGELLIASDLRMGMEPQYFFRFQLAENHNGEWQPADPLKLDGPTSRESRLRWVWHRIWNADLIPISN